MKTKMVWKLTAAFGAVLLFFTLVLGLVFLIIFQRHTLSISRMDMEKRAHSIAQTLSGFKAGEQQAMGNMTGHSGEGHGGMGGYGAYLRFLDELVMAEVWIVDAEGKLITMQHCDMLSSDLPEHAGNIIERVLQGETTYGEEFSSFLETATITVGVPILQNGEVKGAVLLHSPASGTEKAVLQGISILGIGIIIALVFAILGAYVLSLWFTKPMRKMEKTARMLADGQYEARTQVSSSDEIGQLAATIDFLADRLAAAQEERSKMDQMKQEFIANISHELRTPVAVLRGSLEVLRDGTVHEQEEMKEYYEQMLSESKHLERLVGDMLDLSRLQNTQFKLDLSEVNLCDVIRDAARSIRQAAAENEVEIVTAIPDEACFVTGDYGRIRQLLLILLDNAVKYSAGNKPAALILKEEDRQFYFIVENVGTVIEADEIPFLFDRFYRSKKAGNIGGTGFGLAIAKQIAARHGAQILVKSSQGKTEFIVVFPKEKTETLS